MKKELITGIMLMLFSTLCYYVPEYFASASSIDFSNVPDDFHNHYKFRTSGAFLLTAVYAGLLFLFTDSKKYKIKIIFLWLFLAETYTFLNHISDEFFLIDKHDWQEIIVTCIIFTACFSWFLKRSLHTDKSAVFDNKKTYIAKYKPKNLLGILNWLFNLKGHSAIYQDGKIYKFKKCSGLVEVQPLDSIDIESKKYSFEEIGHIENIESLLNKKYNYLKYNCNHLANEASKKSRSNTDKKS